MDLMHQLLQVATPGIDQPQDQLQGGPADRIREPAARDLQLPRAAAATEEVATSSSQDGYDTQVFYSVDDRSYIAF